MAVTVTATGNHYFLDSLVGAAVALTAVALVAGMRRIRPQRKAEVIQLRPRREGLEDARRAA
jgi:membrane-associated phospholipid phosphatase